MDTVRGKVMAVAIVIALLSISVVAVYNTPVEAKNNEINIIAQVNQNGSAIIFKDKSIDVEQYRTIENETLTVSPTQASKWDGLVIGTPGDTTIQHSMLKDFVVNVLKFNFTKWEEQEKTPNTVYYHAAVSDFVKYKAEKVDGCIIWEYIWSQITVSGNGITVIDSKYMSKDHACCVIGAENTYLSSNTDSTIRFLKAYVNSVKEMNEIISNPAHAKYTEFINSAIDYAAITGETKQYEEKIVKSALSNVKYTYGNTEGDVLSTLKENICSFVNNDTNLKSKVLNELGYSDVKEFANEFVNDSYLKDALTEKVEPGTWKTITIATITHDIHQYALHWGISSGKFDEMHIKIELVTAQNGAAVATCIQNGSADMGFMGVPPLTKVTINSELDPAIYCTLSGVIVNESGAPQSNVSFTFTPSCGITYTGRTDETGSFTISVIKGTYAYEADSFKVTIGATEKTGACDPISRIIKDRNIRVVVDV